MRLVGSNQIIIRNLARKESDPRGRSFDEIAPAGIAGRVSDLQRHTHFDELIRGEIEKQSGVGSVAGHENK